VAGGTVGVGRAIGVDAMVGQLGVGELKPVVGALTPGAGVLNREVGELTPGAGVPNPGVGELTPGAGVPNPGVGELNPGVVGLNPAVGVLTPGAGAAAAGLDLAAGPVHLASSASISPRDMGWCVLTVGAAGVAGRGVGTGCPVAPGVVARGVAAPGMTGRWMDGVVGVAPAAGVVAGAASGRRIAARNSGVSHDCAPGVVLTSDSSEGALNGSPGVLPGENAGRPDRGSAPAGKGGSSTMVS
jgi:hypothetical protein